MRRRLLPVLVLAASLTGASLAGCGDDASDQVVGSDATAAPDRSGDVTVTDVGTFAIAGVPDGGLDALRSTVAERLRDLEAFGIAGYEVEATGDVLTVRVEATDEATARRAFDVVARTGVLRFRPVLAVIPGSLDDLEATTTVDGREVVPNLDYTSPDEDLADQAVTLPERAGDVVDGAITATYQLRPAETSGPVIADAVAEEQSNGTWAVRLPLGAGDAGIGVLNRAAAHCSLHDTTCPSGQLAFVVDGLVLSAPPTSQPSYEPDQVQISLEGDRATAQDLAIVLRSGALPAGLTLSGTTHL